jgi:predicted nuclease of restriction endonuclease-like (RecB) superfamily
MREAASQGWTTRALERQISTLYYERLLSSSDRAAVEKEASDSVQSLQRALLDNLQEFLLELGRGFAFVARQFRISTESKDFYIDLVFYNYLLKCFVLFDLKSGELTHQDIGQMDMYVRMTDELKRAPDDNPTVGIILCTGKDASVVRYSVLHENEQIFASRYKLLLPSEEELRAELDRERSKLAREIDSSSTE